MQKGYQYVCSQGSRNSKEVVILYKDNYKILKTEIDNNGNFIIMTIQTQDETFQIVGIYIDTGFGKQKEINQFLTKCKNLIDPDIPLIIAGDLNCFANKEDMLHNTTVRDRQINTKIPLDHFLKAWDWLMSRAV